MSVTSIGASPYPTTQPWSGPPGNWQANRPNDQNADNAVGSTSHNAVINNVTNNGAGTNATRAGGATDANAGGKGTNKDANDRNPNDNNPLPPVQAATAPGTGQKLNIIA